MSRWKGLRVAALLLILAIGLVLPLPGAFASDDEDAVSLRGGVGSLLSGRNRPGVSAETRPGPRSEPGRSGLSAPAPDSAPSPPQTASPEDKSGGKSIRLFGTLEMRSKIGKMPKWTSVLEKERAHPGFTDDRVFPGQGTWKTIKAKLAKMPPAEQLRAVNALINRWPYRTDMDVWGVMDYWEAPVDFFQKSGDCEDFAIAKYFALRDLGFPASKMRIVVLRDTLRNLEHAVTVVYQDGDAWVLDNLSNAVLSHKRLSHYRPQFSVNEEYRWAHLTPGGSARTKTRPGR